VGARLDLRIQFFTSRGFGVVEVNYAGSTGYGRAYRERLTGQWGVLDVADRLDAARSLIQAGEVDGRLLVISGASAGGFTALGALAFDDLFAAGTSAYGIADLETFREQAPKFQAHELDRLVGTYPQAVVTYRARSPVHSVQRFTSPVLLVQGLDDTIVPPSQTQLMAKALMSTGIPHGYLAFEGEGHGFRRPSSIKRALEAEHSHYLDAMTHARSPDHLPHADGPTEPRRLSLPAFRPGAHRSRSGSSPNNSCADQPVRARFLRWSMIRVAQEQRVRASGCC
jgi:dipeptidyl aminopeptidase/acylaminoacyl peptidase